MIKPNVFCAVIGILLSAVMIQAKEWRGIVPTRSDRNEVLRLLGQPIETNSIRSVYNFDDYEVYIVFSSLEICSDPLTPTDRVLLIQVTPRKQVWMSDLKLDESKFRKFSPSTVGSEYQGYIDTDEGLIIRAKNGQVDRLFYVATAKDRGFCPTYYANQERFAQVLLDYLPVKFDSYSNLSQSDERARLDNFALYLLKEPTLYAYAVVFGPGKAHSRHSSGQRIRNYLVKKHQISADRIIVLDGGRRKESSADLYALSETDVLPFKKIP